MCRADSQNYTEIKCLSQQLSCSGIPVLFQFICILTHLSVFHIAGNERSNWSNGVDWSSWTSGMSDP